MLTTAARKRLIAATIFVLFIAAAALEFGSVSKADTATKAVATPASKIAAEVIADTADGERASVVIYLADQADVGAGYAMKDQDARGWYVYRALTEHAERTQAGLKGFLSARGVQFQSYWAANMLVADVDRTLAQEIAARSDVGRVDSNRPARWIEDPAISNRQDSTEKPDVPDTPEWGVMNVNAPAVWAMGFTGQGIVVGDLDTGSRWTHIALKPKYRGWDGTTANHNYNWHDAIHTGGGICGADTVEPCDDSGHGTHTAGSMVGDDGAGNQIGVAPGARWIGCRNMDQGDGTPARYTECFQFAIAPTDLAGNNPDPTLRPHVLNNSWTCPASEGCTTGGELETIVNNTQAAGIFVEASAGNAGPGCSSVSDPPSIYSSSFSTGAIDISNNLASFSSRGPSVFYNPAVLKPNVSAPGVNVRSSYGSGDTDFENLSGTSMAGPHVCGVVALLWSARPQLSRDIAATKAILQNSANPGVTVAAQTCGGIPSTQIPNNSFGYGRVDALAAVNAAAQTPTATATATQTSTPTNTGTPTATSTSTPIPSPSDSTPTSTPTAPAFSIQFSNATYIEDESQVAAINVYRTGSTVGTNSVSFSTSDGTATGGAACTTGVDYVTVTNQTLVFNPGVQGVEALVTICADNIIEPDQTINLSLSGTGLGTPSNAVLTINDTASAYRNTDFIQIDSGAAATSYPSNITVAGGPAAIASMRVTIYDFESLDPDNVDFLLVGPGGQKFILMADSGGASPISTPGVTLNFTDTAGTVVPDNAPLTTNNFEPTSYGAVADFPAPAPAGPYNLPGSTVGGTGTQTLFGNFGAANPNGTWSLYIRDDGTPGVIASTVSGGWGIEFLGTTAANASISGRVITANGNGIRNANVVLSGNSLIEPRVAATGSFGYFTFDDLETGQTYVVTVSSQRYTFSTPSRVISLVDNVLDADFIAEPQQ